MILAISITLFSTVILIEVLQWGTYVKKLLGVDVFDTLKPFDCMPCTAFWLGIISAFIFTSNLTDGTIVITLSFIIARWMQKN